MGRIVIEGCLTCWYYEENSKGNGAVNITEDKCNDAVNIPEDKREWVVATFKELYKVWDYLDELEAKEKS